MPALTPSPFPSFFPPLPKGFITLYDGKTGGEIFEFMYQGLLKLLAKALMAGRVPTLSTRCFRGWGGAKMLLLLMATLSFCSPFLRPEKIFVSKFSKGFDLLGYHISWSGFSLSLKTQGKALTTAKRRYAQGDKKSLLSALKLWRTWVHAGLPFEVNSIEEVRQAIIGRVELTSSQTLSTESEPCERSFPQGLPLSPQVFISSERGEDHFNQKGDLKCKSNFFRHYY